MRKVLKFGIIFNRKTVRNGGHGIFFAEWKKCEFVSRILECFGVLRGQGAFFLCIFRRLFPQPTPHQPRIAPTPRPNRPSAKCTKNFAPVCASLQSEKNLKKIVDIHFLLMYSILAASENANRQQKEKGKNNDYYKRDFQSFNKEGGQSNCFACIRKSKGKRQTHSTNTRWMYSYQ